MSVLPSFSKLFNCVNFTSLAFGAACILGPRYIDNKDKSTTLGVNILKSNNTKISKAVRLAIVLGAGALTAMPAAYAEEADENVAPVSQPCGLPGCRRLGGEGGQI